MGRQCQGTPQEILQGQQSEVMEYVRGNENTVHQLYVIFCVSCSRIELCASAEGKLTASQNN